MGLNFDNAVFHFLQFQIIYCSDGHNLFIMPPQKKVWQKGGIVVSSCLLICSIRACPDHMFKLLYIFLLCFFQILLWPLYLWNFFFVPRIFLKTTVEMYLFHRCPTKYNLMYHLFEHCVSTSLFSSMLVVF